MSSRSRCRNSECLATFDADSGGAPTRLVLDGEGPSGLSAYACAADCQPTDQPRRELRRQGHRVARCTVERLMRGVGLVGVSRGKKARTTVAGPRTGRRRLKRDFPATGPNRTWVADFTDVIAWCGTVYVAFVVDVYSRVIVGWAAATNNAPRSGSPPTCSTRASTPPSAPSGMRWIAGGGPGYRHRRGWWRCSPPLRPLSDRGRP